MGLVDGDARGSFDGVLLGLSVGLGDGAVGDAVGNTEMYENVEFVQKSQENGQASWIFLSFLYSEHQFSCLVELFVSQSHCTLLSPLKKS